MNSTPQFGQVSSSRETKKNKKTTTTKKKHESCSPFILLHGVYIKSFPRVRDKEKRNDRIEKINRNNSSAPPPPQRNWKWPSTIARPQPPSSYTMIIWSHSGQKSLEQHFENKWERKHDIKYQYSNNMQIKWFIDVNITFKSLLKLQKTETLSIYRLSRHIFHLYCKERRALAGTCSCTSPENASTLIHINSFVRILQICEKFFLSFCHRYSRTLMARTALGLWKFVRDERSSSQWGLILEPSLFYLLQNKYMLRVLIRIASSRWFLWVHTIYIFKIRALELSQIY